MNLHREKLIGVQLPLHVSAELRKNIDPIVGHHINTFSARKSIEEQMRALAMDAYCQGAVDGAQVSKMKGI